MLLQYAFFHDLFFYFVIYSQQRLLAPEKERAKQFAAEAVQAIAQDWQPDALISRADEVSAKVLNQNDFAGTFNRWKDAVGGLNKIDGVHCGNLYPLNKTEKFTECRVEGYFTHGEVKFDLTLTQHEKEWKIHGLDIHKK